MSDPVTTTTDQPATDGLTADDIVAATEAAEAARQKTWLEVLAARRTAASQPQTDPAAPAASAAPVTAPPAAAPVDVQAIVDAAVAKALEEVAATFSGPQAPAEPSGTQNPPEASSGADNAAHGG